VHSTRTAVILLQVLIGYSGEARSLQFYCYAQKMITVVIETFARCQLYVSFALAVVFIIRLFSTSAFRVPNLKGLFRIP